MSNIVSDIFNKAKDVTSAAGRKTDEAYRSSRLKLNCVQISGEIKNRYEMLGERLYDMLKSGNEDINELILMSEEIDHCYRRLSEAQSRLDELKKYSCCPHCGEKNKLNSTFCNSCGMRLITTDEEPSGEAEMPDFSEE